MSDTNEWAVTAVLPGEDVSMVWCLDYTGVKKLVTAPT